MSVDNYRAQSRSCESLSEMKVYYFMDDSTTPYVSVIPTATDIVTLGDFKRSFTKKGYLYFCKELDSDMGCEVKIELLDDSCHLRKSKNGFYEIYLISVPGYGTLPRAGTLPRREKMTIGADPEKARRRRSTELNYHDIPTSSQAASSLGTVISRRAGEHLAEMYTSTSEDPYRYDESSRMSAVSSSLYEPLAMPRGEKVRKRKPRKDRFRKAFVPSTIGSATESSMSQELERILEVKLSMAAAPYLGISVVTYEGSILVSEIIKGGAVHMDGRIEVGDQILQVNNHSFENLSDQQAVRLLRDVAATKKPLILFIAKPPKSVDYDSLANLTSETMPLDISLWVQTAAQCTAQEAMPCGYPAEQPSQTFDEGTFSRVGATDDEEEERALYDQRRNGVPMPRQMAEEAARRRENEQNEHHHADLVSTAMDPIFIVRAMARPDSGLQIKNRKWLKILVPMSFIGRDLVDWIMEHVIDLRDRKLARQYSSNLLEKGLIRHVVSKLTFTEKCYYVFGDSVAPMRGADSSQNSGGTLRAEATTEVTYVGSPGPAGLRHIRNPLQTLPHPLADQTHQSWPISPITVVERNGRLGGRFDCDSPVTNDYASMVGVESTASYGMGIGRGYLPHRQGAASDYLAPRQVPPPNTPMGGNCSSLLAGGVHFAPPHPSPCETEFEDDDKRRIIKK